MAIIKQISTPFGVPAEYHRLIRAEVISDERAVVLQVAAYASEEARRSGAQPLRIDQVRVPLSQFVLDPREPFYRVLTDWPLSFLHGGGNRKIKRPRPRCLVGLVGGPASRPMPVRRSWSWGQGHCLAPIWPVPDGRLRVARPRSIGLTLAFGRPSGGESTCGAAPPRLRLGSSAGVDVSGVWADRRGPGGFSRAPPRAPALWVAAADPAPGG